MNGASGCSRTQPVGTSWVTTTTGASMVCRPPHPSVMTNNVRPQTITPSPAVHARQYAALAGVRWKVIPGEAVVTSSSPAWYQSNNRPMVLSAFAM